MDPVAVKNQYLITRLISVPEKDEVIDATNMFSAQRRKWITNTTQSNNQAHRHNKAIFLLKSYEQ